MITIMAYVFSWPDVAIRICIQFANIPIRIIGAFFHTKQKNCAILVMKQLPYSPKSKNSEESGYFEESFLLNQQQKYTSSFFNLQALDWRAWKLVSLRLPGYKATGIPWTQQQILHRKWAKMLYRTWTFVWGTHKLLAVWVPGPLEMHSTPHSPVNKKCSFQGGN